MPEPSPAVIALRAATDLPGIDLGALVAETAIWVHPDVHSANVSPTNSAGAVYPATRRAKGKDEKRGDVVRGIRLDDNTYANTGIKRALGIPKDRLRGYHVCHIWPGTCYDPRYHTSLANLVLVPGPLASLTDYDPRVEAVLQYRAFELFGWHPQESAVPLRPARFPANWQEPKRPGQIPRRSGPRPPGVNRPKRKTMKVIQLRLPTFTRFAPRHVPA